MRVSHIGLRLWLLPTMFVFSSTMIGQSISATTAPADNVSAGSSMIAAFAGPDTLLIVCLILGLVAMGAVTNVFIARRETRSAARLARSRAMGMRELLRTMRMAESIAGIGVWQYDTQTGTQQWSEGLKKLFGIDGEEDFVDGDAETLLFANNIDLIGKAREHKDEREAYVFKFDIYGYEGGSKTITVHACNLRGADDEVQRVVAVVRDETEQVMRERALKISREQAIYQAREARIQADTDSLTGLANRRCVMRELDKMVINARITQMPLVLVMFDIDRFKSVNDTYGHPAGDQVLQSVARIAKEQARDLDLIGRVGGEEFVWVIQGGSDSMARILSERLRQAVAKGSAAGGVPAVTVSIGYTTLQAGDSALSLFARADSALYDAKDAGRNQVCVAA